MSKIICDVCGTRYPDTAEQCPICGYAPAGTVSEPDQTEEMEESVAAETAVHRGGRFSKANVRKRNRNQVFRDEPEVRTKAAETEDDADEADPFEEEENGKGGKLLNVLLVIVILALLAVSSYIFLQFFMPNLLSDKQTESPTMPSETVTEAPTQAPTDAPTEAPTEEPTEAHCEELILDVTDVTLREAGEMYLLNVLVVPENTVDTVMYISSNEAVATVNEEGRVTAVGEGTVVISIFCGEQQVECNVVCDFGMEPTEAPTDAPVEVPTDAEPTETPTEAPTEALKNVTLSVKSVDMTFRSGGQQSTIKMTCDLKASEVTWSSENENVATVSKNGVITRVGAGTTKIIGQYGDQKVEIIIRCPKK